MPAVAAPENEKKSKLALWLWVGAGCLFLIGSLGLTAQLFLSGEEQREWALNSGKRLEFTPDFRYIEGKIFQVSDLENGTVIDTPKPEVIPNEERPEEELGHLEPLEEAPEGIIEPDEAVETNPTPQPSSGLAKAPTGELAPVQQRTEMGIIPVIAQDGTMPWQYFSREFAPAGNKPRIVIVLSGLGLGSLATEAAMALPQPVTLSFSPYSRDLNKWVGRASDVGHEIMLDLPMETDRYPAMDPGNFGLLNALTPTENYARLESVMARTTGYVGLLMQMRETLSENANAIGPLVDGVNKHGLMLVSSDTDTPIAFSQASEGKKIPILQADILLDARITESHIQGQLASLENIAKKQGFALAIGRSFPVTVENIASWSRELDAKGLQLVPLTNLVK